MERGTVPFHATKEKKAAFEAAVKWIEAHSDTKRQDALHSAL